MLGRPGTVTYDYISFRATLMLSPGRLSTPLKPAMNDSLTSSPPFGSYRIYIEGQWSNVKRVRQPARTMNSSELSQWLAHLQDEEDGKYGLDPYFRKQTRHLNFA